MYIDKVWPGNGESYRCLVPEQLTDETCLNLLDEGIVKQFLNSESHISGIREFTARYLGGGLCLKHGRTVSRKRLALMELGLTRQDEIAASVIQQTRQYHNAVNSLSNTILNLKNMCRVHKTLDPYHHNAGNIRTIQNWVGGNTPDTALTVPPPPEKLRSLMEEWFEYVASKKIKTIEDIIVISNQFILIHPFNDGNGRINRALVDAMLMQLFEDNTAYISPYLYRMAHQHKGSMDAPNAIMQGEWQHVFDFWEIALQWSMNKSQELGKCLTLASQKISNKLTLRRVSQQAMQLLPVLAQQPIVTASFVANKMKWPTQLSIQTLHELMDYAVLSSHLLREPQGTTIFECADILNAWEDMDTALFA
jgi:Fic family protein